MTTTKISQRLEQLRQALRAGTMSYGELAELESLALHIEPSDVELLEAAGVPEMELCNDCDEGVTKYPTYTTDGLIYCSWCDRAKDPQEINPDDHVDYDKEATK